MTIAWTAHELGELAQHARACVAMPASEEGVREQEILRHFRIIPVEPD